MELDQRKEWFKKKLKENKKVNTHHLVLAMTIQQALFEAPSEMRADDILANITENTELMQQAYREAFTGASTE